MKSKLTNNKSIEIDLLASDATHEYSYSSFNADKIYKQNESKKQQQPETIHLDIEQKNEDLKRTTISKIQELPQWFNKENYDFSESLSAESWFTELNSRAFFYSMTEPYRNINYSKNPVTSRNQHTLKAHFGKKPINQDHKNKLINFVDTHIDNSEKINAEDIIFTGEISNIEDLKKIDPLKTPITYGFNIEILPAEISPNKYQVNLLTPDTCLIENFKKWALKQHLEENSIENFKHWLIKKRKDLIIEIYGTRAPLKKQIITPKYKIPYFGKSKLNGFYRCALLPYLDLHQWALLNNAKINQDVYGETIFPHLEPADIGSSRLGENTIPKAENVISIIEVLWNQLQSKI